MTAEQRTAKATRRAVAIVLLLQLALLEVGAAFLARAGGGLLAAYVALAAASAGVGALAWGAAGRPPLVAGRWRRRAALLAIALSWLAALGWALEQPRPYAYLLVALLLTGLALLVAHVAGAGLGPLVLACPLLLVGTVLFGAQLLWPAPPAGLVGWGDASTFRSEGFLTKPPFVFPGGRLEPNLDVRMRSREEPHGVRLITNSEGFRNRVDVPYAPAPGELRVLDLGDSFSIGMQIDQDEFFGARLERELAAISGARTVTVLNAEISDPAHGLYFLQNHGAEYAPRVVVMGLCGNDMHQVDQFCGPGSDQRFVLRADGRLAPNPAFVEVPDALFGRYADLVYPGPARRPAPRRAGWLRDRAWELRELGEDLGQYALVRAVLEALDPGGPPRLMGSYLAEHERRDGRMRLIDACGNLGYFYRPAVPLLEEMYRGFFEVLAALDRVAREQGARLAIVMFPQRYQVNAADWRLVRDHWNLAEEDFDLRQYDRRVLEFCARAGIPCCDLLDAFLADGRQLYLPGGDMHLNRAGYRLAAEVFARFLVEAGVLPDPASLEPGAPEFEAAARRADPEPLRPWRFDASVDEPGGGLARFDHGAYPSDSWEHVERVLLRAASSTPTRVSYALNGRARTFRAQVWNDGARGGPARCLDVRVDGSIAWSRRLPPGRTSCPLVLDLRGAQRLELAVEPLEPPAMGDCVVLSNPCFERAPFGADPPPDGRRP